LINKNRPIVFLASVLHFGGAIKSTLALIEELNKKEDVIILDVCGYCPEYIAELGKRNINYEIICPKLKNPIIGNHPIIRFWRMLILSFSLLKVICRLRKILDKINPRIIWMNSERSIFSVRKAVGTKFPTLMFIRGQHTKLRWYCLKDWKKLDLIVGNNDKSLNFFRRFDWASDKLAVAYNGIDFEGIQKNLTISENLPCKDAGFKIVMPATLIPLKAHSVAIKGFAKFCKHNLDSVLWICGDHPNKLPLDYENSLHELCHTLGVADKVFFLGWRSDVPVIIKVSDVMILTSKTEGLPRSILEAMALGVPVISTRVGGIPEVIRDGKDGILIDIGDSNGVTKALSELKHPEFRHRIANSAMNRVKTDFTIEKQAKAFLACVDKIVSVKQKE